MKKPILRALFLIFSSLLLLVTATVSGTAQTKQEPEPPATEFQTLSGRIRWRKDMGVVPRSPDSNEPSENICAPFYVGVIANSQKGEGLTAYTDSLERGRDEADYYICRYTIKNVPANRSLLFMVGMGDVSSLPNPAVLPFHYTLPWIGADSSKTRPPRGSIRSFSQNNRYIRIGSTKGTFLGVDLTYTPKP